MGSVGRDVSQSALLAPSRHGRLSVVITTAGRQCTANLHPRLSTVVDAVVVVVLCQGGPALAKLELIRKTRFPALALAPVKFRTVFTIQ
jgi:hypothetical protein